MALPLHAYEYSCVIKLVNLYVAVHVKGNEKTFISEHPEKDIEIAKAAAKTFAKTQIQKITYKETLLEPDRPLITVVKDKDSLWYPAELHPDCALTIKGYKSIKFGGSQQEAVELAQVIALMKKADFLPIIGISACTASESQQKNDQKGSPITEKA